MKRTWKQFVGICMLIMVICLGVAAAVWISSRRETAQVAKESSDTTPETGTALSDHASETGAELSGDVPGTGEAAAGDSESGSAPEEGANNYIEGQLARECEEKYGTDTKVVFEFSLEDPEGMLDFDRINGLKTYIAEPSGSGEELIRKMAGFFWEGEDYTTHVTEAKAASIDVLKHWGDNYVCTDEKSGEKIHGNGYGLAFTASGDHRKVDDKEGFIRQLCEEIQFGLGDHAAYDWELRQEWEYGIKNYALKERLDGLWINNHLTGEGTDSDGVDYLSSSHFFYFEGDSLKSAETLYSAEIVREEDAKRTFQSIDELQEYIKDQLYRQFDKAEGHEVYRLNRFYLFYARGITKEQEFVYSPWLICEGPTAWMWVQPDRYWDDFDGAVALNLSSGEVYALGGAGDLLRNYQG